MVQEELEFNVLGKRCIVSVRRKHRWTATLTVYVSAFSLMTSPQVLALMVSGYMESEVPAEDDGETSARELVLASPHRRRRCRDNQDHRFECRSFKTDHVFCAASYKIHASVRTGHRLTNGLMVPLLI